MVAGGLFWQRCTSMKKITFNHDPITNVWTICVFICTYEQFMWFFIPHFLKSRCAGDKDNLPMLDYSCALLMQTSCNDRWFLISMIEQKIWFIIEYNIISYSYNLFRNELYILWIEIFNVNAGLTKGL